MKIKEKYQSIIYPAVLIFLFSISLVMSYYISYQMPIDSEKSLLIISISFLLWWISMSVLMFSMALKEVIESKIVRILTSLIAGGFIYVFFAGIISLGNI